MLKKVFTLAYLIGLVGCAQSTENTAVQSLGQSDIAPTAAMQANACRETDSFAVQVFSALAAAQKNNFVFSPASLEGVLRLLQQGARGATAAELAALPMGKPGVRTAMNPAEANALFISEQIHLNPAIQADDIVKVPFAKAPQKAADTINSWVKSQTRGLIPSVISARDISPNTALVAANAIYLKEKWLHPFPARDTHADADFTLEDGSTIHVAMMRSKANYRYAEGKDWSAVAIPYKPTAKQGEPGYFIGILPKDSARSFAGKLTPQLYQDIRKALAGSPEQSTIVYLPRFEVDPGTYSLKPALQACGLKGIFSMSADLSGFADAPLYLDDVLQRCYCKADEEGTQAAAVTVATVRTLGLPRGPRAKVIAFDKPFVWVIDDLNTPAAPYFMGIIQKP